ncbi:hypothetical protein TNIN_64031 [Trichonephila inaurata madagascariensis]|uniref:Uncharacterized protein n=1 Tax=Trichonephila inaurata madagascariensis TaxID=2747483 RepID=A0A8X6XIY6_9ARAC|nr:hypothetical protein TNIN_64031 [Trichonephila inaurata madagascariensis]
MRLIEDFNEIPTLGFITSIQLVITIWNLSTILRSIQQYLNPSPVSQNLLWREIEDNVKSIAENTVEIPPLLKPDLNVIIKPIGHHIRAMKTFLYFCPNVRPILHDFRVSYFTPYGTVDTKRVEKLLVKDQTLEYGFRYILACNNCFEELVQQLFDHVEVTEINYYKEKPSNVELLSYWTHRMLRTTSVFRNLAIPPGEVRVQYDYTAEELALMYSMQECNKAGIEYFTNCLPRQRFEDISQEHFSLLLTLFIERGACRLPPRPDEHKADSIYCLLSRLNENVRSNILNRNYSYRVLRIFLSYPFYGLFNTYANKLISHLRESDTFFLLHDIISLQYLNEHFFGYELFRDLWHICPENHKEYAREKCGDPSYVGTELVQSAIILADEALAT